MFKIVLIVIGICIGYFMGFSDGRTHKRNVVQRVVAHVGIGGSGANNVDSMMDKVDKVPK